MQSVHDHGSALVTRLHGFADRAVCSGDLDGFQAPEPCTTGPSSKIRVRVVGNGMNCDGMDQEQQQWLLGQPRPSKRPRTAAGAAGSGNGTSSSMQNQQDSSPPQVESALHADPFRPSQHRSSAGNHHNLHVTLPFGGTRQMRNGRERNTSLASLDSAMTAAASVQQLPQDQAKGSYSLPTWTEPDVDQKLLELFPDLLEVPGQGQQGPATGPDNSFCAPGQLGAGPASGRSTGHSAAPAGLGHLSMADFSPLPALPTSSTALKQEPPEAPAAQPPAAPAARAPPAPAPPAAPATTAAARAAAEILDQIAMAPAQPKDSSGAGSSGQQGSEQGQASQPGRGSGKGAHVSASGRPRRQAAGKRQYVLSDLEGSDADSDSELQLSGSDREKGWSSRDIMRKASSDMAVLNDLPPQILPLLIHNSTQRRGKGGRQPAEDPRLDPKIDPKRAKRILANRMSAARSKMKQKLILEGLKAKQEMLRLQIQMTQDQLGGLGSNCQDLEQQNGAIQRKIEALKQGKKGAAKTKDPVMSALAAAAVAGTPPVLPTGMAEPAEPAPAPAQLPAPRSTAAPAPPPVPVPAPTAAPAPMPVHTNQAQAHAAPSSQQQVQQQQQLLSPAPLPEPEFPGMMMDNMLIWRDATAGGSDLGHWGGWGGQEQLL